MIRVAALVPYHADSCAGQRFRMELWARHLVSRGIVVEFFPFTDERLTQVLYAPGQKLAKATELARCYALQAARLARAAKPDVVYLYREAALVGPALLERIASVWGVPMIYDIDEPLFQPYVSPTSGRFNALKFFSKYDQFIARADRVWAVNEAIAEHARPIARVVDIVPMAVDTDRYVPGPVPGATPLRIGWMGTRTSQKNLAPLAAPLRRLASEHPLSLRVLADETMALDGLDVEFVPWSFAAEVPLLRECAIGVVPVLRDVWSQWKFYFKLIQFMSLGIPTVASAEGSNLEIIVDGENGFLARTEDEWYEKLRLLATDPKLRRAIAANARQTALERFSLAKQLDFVERTIKELA